MPFENLKSVTIDIWTVYDHPTDYPNNVVARLWRVQDGGYTHTGNILVADDLKHMRKLLRPSGLTRLDRYANDDPKIVECWL